ncbi:hypothetical protein KKD80_04050 [Patescibacteria group bacterium]|nr:hypothetical protein [Patescibacteria group bacterium]
MSALTLGLICGLAFGVVDVLVMLPIKFEDKRKKWEAFASAFIDRFILGFLVPIVNLGIHPALSGVILGLGLSLPSAIITRVYVPIVGIGVLGGLIIGFIANFVL